MCDIIQKIYLRTVPNVLAALKKVNLSNLKIHFFPNTEGVHILNINLLDFFIDGFKFTAMILSDLFYGRLIRPGSRLPY